MKKLKNNNDYTKSTGLRINKLNQLQIKQAVTFFYIIFYNLIMCFI